MNQPLSTSHITFSPEEWAEFRQRFSEMKHAVNNSLAVFMALSELAERNPDNLKKLAQVVMTRTPDIVSAMQDFTRAMDTKMGRQTN